MTEVVGTITGGAANDVVAYSNTLKDIVTSRVASSTFIYFVGFDGTDNIKTDPGYSGTVQSTAVGALTDAILSIQNGGNPNVYVDYLAGVGTPDTSAISSFAPLDESIRMARDAYDNYGAAANEWLKEHPGGDVTAMMTTFSRGSVAGAIFSQMLYEEGLVYDGKVLVPPGQAGISGALILSPVDTGAFTGEVRPNLAFAPNCENIVDVIALNEYRTEFHQNIYDGVTNFFQWGNHGDIGTFYPDGLSALYLQAYTDFFRAAGLGVNDPSNERQYSSDQPKNIHLEELTAATPWNISDGSYEDGTPIKLVGAGSGAKIESTSTGTVETFTDYQGRTVVITKIGGITQTVKVITPETAFISRSEETIYRIATPTETQITNNPDGSKTVIALDGAGRMLASTTTHSSGQIDTTEYSNGEPSRIIKQLPVVNGSQVVETYDANGNLQGSVTTTSVVSGTVTTDTTVRKDGAGNFISSQSIAKDSSTGETTSTNVIKDGSATVTVSKEDGSQVTTSTFADGGALVLTTNLATHVLASFNYSADGVLLNSQHITLNAGASYSEVRYEKDGSVWVIEGRDHNGKSSGTVTTINQVGVPACQIVKTQIGDQVVQVKFDFDVDGNTYVSDILTIDGKQPLQDDKNMIIGELNAAGVTPDSLISTANTLKDASTPWAFDPNTGEPLQDSAEVAAARKIQGQFAVINPNQLHGIELATQIGSTALDINSFLVALNQGDALPIATTGLRLANDFSNLADPSHPLPNLSAAANVGTAILSYQALKDSLDKGDNLGAVTATAQMVSSANAALTSIGSQYANKTLGATLNGGEGSLLPGNKLGQGAMTYLALANDLRNKDYKGAAIDVMALAGVPGMQAVLVAYAVYNLVNGMNDEPPMAWGSGRYVWENGATGISVGGESFGVDRVNSVMDGFEQYLQSIVDDANLHNAGNPLALVPNRMPALTWREARFGADGGYAFTDIDPLTGDQQYADVRYGDDFVVANKLPSEIDFDHRRLDNAFVLSALARGAIAAKWEADTARIQTQNGDPLAGLSEAERAGRRGLLAQQASNGPTPKFRVAALDLNGDDVISTIAKGTVAFNWDDSGFYKNTEWLNKVDGFLVIDRDLNDHIDTGKELFTNALLADGARASLLWHGQMPIWME